MNGNALRIETPRLVLRKAEDRDVDSIWRNVWQDDRLAKTMLWQVSKTREEALQRMDRTKKYQAGNTAYFVCLKETDEPIGFAGVVECENRVYEDSGICIAFDHQNKGYGAEVLHALIYLVFDVLNGQKFIYGCFHENKASAVLCKKCGFTYSHSTHEVRTWDGYAYQCDFYQMMKKEA